MQILFSIFWFKKNKKCLWYQLDNQLQKMLMGLELLYGAQMMEQPKTCWEPIAEGCRQTDQIIGISGSRISSVT